MHADVVHGASYERRKKEITTALRRLVGTDHPPDRIDKRSFCRKCAFEELCYA